MPQIISSTQYTLNLTPLVISKKSEYKLYLMRVRSLKIKRGACLTQLLF